ncbi:iron complex transport system ATP-binding protein [Breznakia blatticola]|uniref:Iron complex transport system ATP-binding protein n=1 Tax=Breznakia blatticola TaxID=1754012 RepID=A0A4R7ZJ92_9FIRM|nr:ABC transporter ATP-binding protein [Breznakia blatticola]TDW16458.1 iron complex transport system ATP-binding protein [Breznakia blatticola]
MKQHTLQANHIVAGYDKKMILDDVSVDIPDGKITVIIGSNASGKSTLLKTFARLLPVSQGEIKLDGKDIHTIPTKELAQILGLLPQSPIAPEGISVSDLVARGRFPYQKFMGGMSDEDTKAVADALDMMGIAELADRSIDELSGGQRQRVWIAMALAQDTDILFLDEPTTYLDITYQLDILELLKRLNETHKTTIVMVLHDINLSARYADYMIAVKDGEIVAHGTPKEIVTEDTIQHVFGLDCMIIEDPVAKTPMIVPKGNYFTNT